VRTLSGGYTATSGVRTGSGENRRTPSGRPVRFLIEIRHQIDPQSISSARRIMARAEPTARDDPHARAAVQPAGRSRARPASWDDFDARPIKSPRTLDVVSEVCVGRFHNFASSILIELVENPGENPSQSIWPSVPTILPTSKAHVKSTDVC
jgi:hypothetical protein